MTSLRRPRPDHVVPAVVSALVAVLVLGPALGRGVVLAYDLAWSPDPRLTPFTLGTSTPAPRAVPSDAAGVVLGSLLGAGPAQALVLFGILVLAGNGAARLARLVAPGLGVSAMTVAAIAAIWNPFVLERLVVGQWTVLLGYAAAPHLLVACLRVPARSGAGLGPGRRAGRMRRGRREHPRHRRPRGGRRAPGTTSAMGRPRARRSIRARCLGRLGAARRHLRRGVLHRRGRSVRRPRRHPPRRAGSLLSGGAFWNPASHPASREVLVLALVALVLALVAVGACARAARQQKVLAMLVPAGFGLLLAWFSALDPFGLWTALVVHVPGGGLLRDSQKLLAPWVAVASAGMGLLVRDLLRLRAAGLALAVLVAALPVALLPSLAWGVDGRVTAVQVPADLRSAATLLSEQPPGSVGLLPWSQYRRYAWNGSRVSLTLVPRMVDQRVVLDDGLPLANGVVPGEDPAARAVGARIAAGALPLQALADEGVRWVVVEKRTGLPDPLADGGLPPTARIIRDGPTVSVIELAGPRPDTVSGSGASVLGWAVTCITWVVAAGCVVLGTVMETPPRAGTVRGMPFGIAALVSLVVGIALGLLAIFGGVSLITPKANPASASDQIVRYDAP